MCFWLVENECIFHAAQVQLYNGGKLQIACAHCQNFACFDFLWCFFLWQSPNLRKKSNVKTHFTKCMVTVMCGGRWRGWKSLRVESAPFMSCTLDSSYICSLIHRQWPTHLPKRKTRKPRTKKKQKQNKNESARVRMINFKEQVASHSPAKEGEWCNLC